MPELECVEMEAGQNISKHRQLALATSLSILRVAEIACRYRRLQSGPSQLHDTICQSDSGKKAVVSAIQSNDSEFRSEVY